MKNRPIPNLNPVFKLAFSLEIKPIPKVTIRRLAYSHGNN